MKDIQAIARYMRLPEDQLKFPIELLNQGYEPNYLANYRPDELGSIDEQTLSILRRALNYSESLKVHKEKVQQTLEREQQWNETVSSVISQANTISQVDTVIRHLRARRNSRSIAEKCPQVESVGQAILTMQGDPPKDLLAWVAETASVPLEQAADVLENTKRWMVHLLSEDVRLMQDLQLTILKRASISVKVLPDPPRGSDEEKRLEHSENISPVLQNAATTMVTSESASRSPVLADDAAHPTSEIGEQAENGEAKTELAADVQVSSDSTNQESITTSSTDVQPEELTASAPDQAMDDNQVLGDPSHTTPNLASTAPLIVDFQQGKKPGKGLKTKTLSDKQLSPRQRRRKWLRSILESYSKLRKPLSALTPYQILMLSRGQRSQIVSIQFHYDEKPLVQVCRESLCPGRHPMHYWLVEIAEEGLRSHILPRLHQDVFAILEEDAHTDLTEAAVVHLQASLLQRPVRGHRILVIDAIGPKMAAVSIVDAEGNVVFTNEIACNSNRADVVAQNVVSLGQWIHEHKVTLLALSNGPARRYLIHTVSELLKQSADGSLYWTMVDRAGADGYCMSRGCLVELPRISRRHRAATWLAWRLQDPLKQILKVDPVRLRLGSYQRELPQRELEAALQDAVSAAITKAGVDVFYANVDVLKRIPGMTTDAAKAVVQACHDDKITNREALMSVLREHLSEMHARQAIGFLKVYSSSNTLDGTTVHPDDYRLAERLVAHANITMPAAAPDNWTKPNYAELDVAHAAATIEHAKQVTEEPFAGSLELEDAGGEIGSEEAVQSPDASPTNNSTTEVEVPSDTAPPETAPPETAPPETAPPETASSDGSAVATGGVPGSESVAESTSDTTPASVSDAGESNQPTVPLTPRSSVPMPPIPTAAMERPTLSIDVERLARSWQVGREKMKRVANCLQFSFADSRDFQFPMPLLCKVPRLDNLQSGMMLQALVIGVADFGVFVDLGPDCSGLIHISRLAPDFIEDPHQFVQVGDLVPVWVLNVDEKKKRVSLTAIPPGTPSRRSEHGSSGPNEGSQDRGGQGRGNQAGGDNRNQRNDRNQTGARDSGPRQSQPQSADRTGRPAGSGSGSGSGGDRSRSSGGDSRSSQGGGNRGGKSFGRDGNRDRGRNNSESADSSQSRRPTRVDPPKPVTPISDAMQKGKEPLRSFSDLLQFIKKSKDEPTVEQTATPELETSVRSSDAQNETPVENSSQGVETTDRGDASAPSA